MPTFISIQDAIEELKQGRMIILVDDDHREQEGDLVVAAEKITPEAINFMTRYARVGVWLTLPATRLDALHIPLMPERNKHINQAAFATSIEAARGVTTGASAEDRAHTIRVVMDPQSTCQDISMPGHVFPLKAAPGGVLERPGHTEGSVDLTRLAGCVPGALIGEIMNEDGSMAKGESLYQFAELHHLPLVAINDLVTFRMQQERVIEEVASSPLPIFQNKSSVIRVFRECYQPAEHIALIQGEIDTTQPVLVRIHSECLTGDVFGSQRCDCGWQLETALEQLSQENGILLYMRQEGRGIGLGNKIKSYQLQSQGLDTVEANHQLGFLADHRHYGISAQMLRFLGVKSIRLLTNNPSKLQDMQRWGIEVVERIPLEMVPTSDNKHYLATKKNKLGHWLTK